MEALNAELDAAKEAVFIAKQQTSETEHVSSINKLRTSPDMGSGWLMGIGLAIIAGAVLYHARGDNRNTKVSTSTPEQRRLVAAAPATSKRSIFSME